MATGVKSGGSKEDLRRYWPQVKPQSQCFIAIEECLEMEKTCESVGVKEAQRTLS
jgi:hypothetical protein